MYFASCSLIFTAPAMRNISLSASASGPVEDIVTFTSTSSALFSSLKLGIIIVPSIAFVVPVTLPYIKNMVVGYSRFSLHSSFTNRPF